MAKIHQKSLMGEGHGLKGSVIRWHGLKGSVIRWLIFAPVFVLDWKCSFGFFLQSHQYFSLGMVWYLHPCLFWIKCCFKFCLQSHPHIHKAWFGWSSIFLGLLIIAYGYIWAIIFFIGEILSINDMEKGPMTSLAYI